MELASLARRTVVGLGELRISVDGSEVLISLGLGSCVALCLYDPVARVAGMAHMVLPSSEQRGRRPPSPRFVDYAVPALVEDMRDEGASKQRLTAKLIGGAQMLNGTQGPTQIGERNVAAAREALSGLRIRLTASDTGGTRGRTVRLDVATGTVTVSIVSGSEREL
ncbi:MAG: chemotaxis protein CheD [Dehalococcoidia bacterium]